jgi:glutamate synthase domain-containing protein 1
MVKQGVQGRGGQATAALCLLFERGQILAQSWTGYGAHENANDCGSGLYGD